MQITELLQGGQLVSLLMVVGICWRLDSKLRQFLVEHNILLQDYCERKGIRIESLPTRMR